MKIIGIAKKPNLFVIKGILKEKKASSNVSIFETFINLFGSLGDINEGKEKVKKYIELVIDKRIHVDYENVYRLRIDNTGTLAMISEKRGRILLADLQQMLIIKIWKGMRESWMTFYELGGMKYAALYSNVRGLLEIYRLRHGCKLYSRYIETDLKLFDLLTPTIFSKKNYSLYRIELKAICSELDENYLRKLFVEDYLQQDNEAKEIVKILMLGASKEYVKLKVNKINSIYALYGFYETTIEIAQKGDVALWIEEAINNKLEELLQNTNEGEMIKSFLKVIKENHNYFLLYADIARAIEEKKEVTNKTELEKWLTNYDYILKSKGTPQIDFKIMPLKEFITKIKNKQWKSLIPIVMETLRSTYEVLNRITPKEQGLCWFMNWLYSISNNCYSNSRLRNICAAGNNPLYTWLNTIKNSINFDKFKEYCFNCANMLHVAIIANILKDIKPADKDFETIETAAKFYLLVLSNLNYPILPQQPFVLGGMISIYEYIGECQVLNKEDNISTIQELDHNTELRIINSPIRFLYDLIKVPVMVKDLLVCGYLLSYVKSGNSDITQIIKQYKFIENKELSVGFFLYMWKTILGPKIARCNKDLTIIKKAVELFNAFLNNLKIVQSSIVEYISKNKIKLEEIEVKKILMEVNINKAFYKGFTKKHKDDILHNMLYISPMHSIKDNTYKEINNYLKYHEDNKLGSPSVSLVKLVLSILEAKQELYERKGLYNDILDIASVKEVLAMKELDAEKVWRVNDNLLEQKKKFLREYMKLDTTKAQELCSMLNISREKIGKDIIREKILTENDKDLDGYLILIEKDASQFLVDLFKERLAKYSGKANSKSIDTSSLKDYQDKKSSSEYKSIKDLFEVIKKALNSDSIKILEDLIQDL